MNSIEIRPTAPADLADLAIALVQVHRTDGYPVEGVENPSSWVELPDAIGQWTALLKGKPVGHVALLRPSTGDGAPQLMVEKSGVPVSRVAVLARLFVAPHARGRGLAWRLVATVEVVAREAGLSVVLDVMSKDVAAIKLYERRGWVELGRLGHQLDRGPDVPAVAYRAP